MPALVIDTVMVVPPTPIEVGTEPPPPGAYLGMGPLLQRLTPVIHIVPLDLSHRRSQRRAQGPVHRAHRRAWGPSRHPEQRSRRSVWEAAGLVTLEGAARGVALQLDSLVKNTGEGRPARRAPGLRRPRRPAGIAFADKETAYVYGFLDRTVSKLDFKAFADSSRRGGGG